MSGKRAKKKGKKSHSKPLGKAGNANNNSGDMLKAAVAHHQSGRMDLAWDMYQQVLEKNPQQQDALHLSGLIAQGRGDLVLAENLIRSAIKSSPETLLFYRSLSSVLSESGQYAEVEEILNKIIKDNPGDIYAVHDLGIICKRMGKTQEAIEYFRGAVKYKPDFAEAHNNLGSCYADEGEVKEAAACFELAIKHKPDFAEAYNNLGIACRESGEEQQAESLFRKAVELRPDYYKAYDNLGGMLIGLDKVDEGLKYIEKALEINPAYIDAQCNRSIALMQLDDLESAEISSLKILNLEPGKKEALNNLGLVYMKMGRMNEAIKYYKKAIYINSQFEDAIQNLANVYTWLGNLDKAFECFEKLFALNKNSPTAHYNYSYTLLLNNEFTFGWQEYEWRFKTKNNSVMRHCGIPRWQGEDMHERTLLVYAEQGIGDEIRFANCIPDVIKQAKHVVIECDPRLQSLYQRSFLEASVVGVKRNELDWLSTAPPIDLQIAVGSLPLYTRSHLEDFPQKGGYLKADPVRVTYWEQRLQSLGSAPKVGIAWRGGLSTAERNLNYPDFKQHCQAILQVPGIQFINLMYDECSEDLEWARRELGVDIHDFGELDQFNDMEGVAGLLSALDLMITVPIAVSEMAGALAIPTWYIIFTHHVNTLGSDHLPWFPHTRCFFKDRVGEWGPVMEKVAQNLLVFQNDADTS